MKLATKIITSLVGIATMALPAFSAPVFLNGAVSQEHVATLMNEVHWNNDLYTAEQQASRDGKMVFWVHMLGRMDGAT